MNAWIGGIGTTVLLLTAAPAGAQINCGDTLGPGGSFAATANIGPCVQNPAVRIVGGVTVDFAGYEVLCDSDANDGILIEGKSAKVSNGSAKGCDVGVRVAGEGKHKVNAMSAEGNKSFGFVLDSGGNKLTYSLAIENGFDTGIGDGFDVNGDKNRLAHNWGIANDQDGFELDGEKCKFSENVAVLNGNVGIRSDGNKGKVTKCLAADNDADGYVASSNSAFTKNVATSNIGSGNANGFLLLSSAPGVKITKNVSAGNTGDGFGTFFTSDGAKFTKNQAFANGGSGIEIPDGSTENTIKSNVAIGHGSADLADMNLDCDNNVWSKNLFGSADPDTCIE